MNERFEVLNQFKGFGTPERSVWFIGIEEAGVWNADFQSESDRFELFSRGHFPSSCEGEKSKIYESISKIVVGLTAGIDVASSDWRAFRDRYLFQPGVRVFQANLYPLGKPNLGAWPPHYEDLFDIGAADRKAYIQVVKERRFPALRAFWQQQQAPATICFGKTFWPEFRELLELNVKDKNVSQDHPFEVYPEQKVILTPFFGRGHMSDARLQAVQALLKAWGIKVYRGKTRL